MRALKNIDVAFICMNWPYTMPPQESSPMRCARSIRRSSIPITTAAAIWPIHQGRSGHRHRSAIERLVRESREVRGAGPPSPASDR